MRPPSMSNRTYSVVRFKLEPMVAYQTVAVMTGGVGCIGRLNLVLKICDRIKIRAVTATLRTCGNFNILSHSLSGRLQPGTEFTSLYMSVSSQYAISTKSTGTPRVRRRRLALLVVLLAGILLFLFAPWEIPGISRANVGQLIKQKKLAVEEIYGLLHLVTGDHEQAHVLNKVDLDPTTPLAMAIYAAGDSTLDWHKEMALINAEYPVVIFSKVRVCSPLGQHVF